MEKLERCYTVEEVAERYQVVPHTVRRWIRKNMLGAIDLTTYGERPQYAIRTEDLEAFEEIRFTLRPGRKPAQRKI